MSSTTQSGKFAFDFTPGIALLLRRPCRRVLDYWIWLNVWIIEIGLQQRRHHKREIEADLAHQLAIVERNDGERIPDDDGVLGWTVYLSPEALCKVGDLRLAPFDEAWKQSQHVAISREAVTYPIPAHSPGMQPNTSRWCGAEW